MDAFFTMLRCVALFVALALPGYIFVKCKFLKSEQSGVLSFLLTYVGMPFLVLSNTLDIELNAQFAKNALLCVALSLLFSFGVFFLTKPLSRYLKDEKKEGMMRFCMTFANNGFLGIPLATAVFGNSVTVTYLVIINVVDSVLRYTTGIYLISGNKEMISPKKVIFSPALIAFAIGIVFNLLNAHVYVPELKSFSDSFSNIVTPLCMTILGMKLGGVKLSSLFKSKRTYYVSVWKLVIFPIVAVALFYVANLLFYTGAEPIFAALIAYGTPVAALSTAFADQFDGDMEGAVKYTLASTVLSVVTIPILYSILCLIV